MLCYTLCVFKMGWKGGGGTGRSGVLATKLGALTGRNVSLWHHSVSTTMCLSIHSRKWSMQSSLILRFYCCDKLWQITTVWNVLYNIATLAIKHSFARKCCWQRPLSCNQLCECQDKRSVPRQDNSITLPGFTNKSCRHFLNVRTVKRKKKKKRIKKNLQHSVVSNH